MVLTKAEKLANTIAWQKRNPRLMIYYRVIETREQAFKEMGLL